MKHVDYSKYPVAEARKPRAHFTEKLIRACKRLVESSERVMSFTPLLPSLPDHAYIRISRLWVVGSYARGATTCGDLDLVAECKTLDGMQPFPAVIKKNFFGPVPSVSLYCGTPQDNTSGVAFADAVLVWEQGLDWQAAIKAIPKVANAGRFWRETDEIPVRLQQTTLDWAILKGLLELERDGKLTWKFVPLTRVESVFDPSEDEKEAAEMLCEQSEAKRQLAPAVLGLARQLRREKGVDEAPCQRCFDDRHLCFGGVEVHVERANFDHRTLDSIRKTCIVFAPKLSTRGPNGFWVIERGPEHPLTKQFAEASAWIQEVGGGRSVETLFCYDAFEASGPTLFATQEAGLTEVAGWIQDDPEAGYRLRELRGSQVLEAIAGHDLVECWDSSGAFPLTQRGKEYVRACEDEALTLAQFSDYAHGKTTEAA